MVFSQLNENFNDGDFSQNPKWLGDSSFFIVNSSAQLQSQGPPLSSEIYLKTNFDMSQNSIWQFYSKLDFSTSSSNHARFYLSSDKNDLSSDLNGYYVKLGGESGADDGIDLYRQEGNTHSKVIDGIPGYFGRDSNQVSVKIIKSYEGEWSLWADTSLKNNFIFQGSAFDNSFHLDTVLGIYCKHSSTRRDKFFFDSIFIQDGPFELMNCRAQNDSLIEVLFSNPIDSGSALNPYNYTLNSNNSHPKAVFKIDSLPYHVFLISENKLFSGDHTLKAVNILDRQNQNLITDSCHFSYYPAPLEAELIINEIMYDPNPVVGMPAAEFVELLSIASQKINLKDIYYSDSNTEILFPEILLDSGEYLILCDIEDTAEFKWFGKVHGLNNWPTLNNSGDVLTLRNKDYQSLDQINYDAHWADGSAKDEGGWSFERINPFKKCTDIQNWSYSVDGAGGTPGEINSIFNSEPDIKGPELSFIEVFSATYIRLVFDEILNQSQLLSKHIRFEPDNQINATLITENTIEISLQTAMDSGKINILIIDSIFDCEGNFSINETDQFGLGKSPELYDIIINEIMFDPEPQNALPASEYIELYNSSDNIISLNSVLAISENDSTELASIIVYPNDYLILCPGSKFEEFNAIGNTSTLSPWISLKNDQDEILLFHNDELIHKVNYSSEWISDSDKREGGWSLEVIDPNNPCGEEFNWNASIDQKGGSPGAINSIASPNLDLNAARINSLDIKSRQKISLTFNEFIDFNYLHLNNLKIEPDNEVIHYYHETRLGKELDLFLFKELQNNQEYYLELSQINDCSDNYSEQNISFILPESPKQNDVIINEVLFNPYSGGSEFIEIYNRSTKNIALKNTILKNYGTDGKLRSTSTLTNESLTLKAFEFLVMCKDSNAVIEHYPKHGNNYLEIPAFPTLNNDSGILTFLDSNHTIIDSAEYSEDFHFTLLNDEKGVSLERISSDISGLQNDNWTSASETFSFASPGIVNSKSIERINGEENVRINPIIFSPDGDGYKDLLHIQFDTENINAIASLNIFDVKGRLVRCLANNFTLSFQNDFIWDGIDEYGKKAKMGNYIILIDLFYMNGHRNKIKKVIGLGGRI